MDLYEINVNQSNTSSKCSTPVLNNLFADNKGEVALHTRVPVTASNDNCQCKESISCKKTDLNSGLINFSYDNMGYG